MYTTPGQKISGEGFLGRFGTLGVTFGPVLEHGFSDGRRQMSLGFGPKILKVANQTVVQAQAQARSNVARAEGESQAIKVITDQLRQDPQYLQWQSINRWNGQLPYSLGSSGATPFFQLPMQAQPQQLSQNQTRQ